VKSAPGVAGVLGGPADVIRYERPDDLAVIEGESTDAHPSRVYLTRLPYGPLVVLEGSSAAIWHEAQAVEETGLVDRLSETAGLPAASIQADVESFLEQLVGAGLLRRVTSS
jgi:Coenzyme PQQ synthesis protein D (PqqD)